MVPPGELYAEPAPHQAVVLPLKTTSSISTEKYVQNGSVGRSAPHLSVSFNALHTKYEDKWLICRDTYWPTQESSMRGTERSKPAFVSKTVTAELEHLSTFTESVHNGGRLVTFIDKDTEGLRSASFKTAPAELPSVSGQASVSPAPGTGFMRAAPEPLKYSVFAIMDGHSGHEAAEYLMSVIRKLLHARLPALHVMPQKGTSGFAQLLLDIRNAAARAIVVAERNFAAAGHLSGSTCTLCILVDWVLTVVNLGDSTAFLDNGESVIQLSEDHNLEASASELQRIQDAGVLTARLSVNLDGPAKPGSAGLGPLRCWPGGLCVSRTFGDFDAPEALLSAPFVRQVLLPERGSRIVLASDGLWAIQSGDMAKDVIVKSRSMPAIKASSFLVNKARTSFGLKDDVSVIVLDVLPNDVQSFSSLVPGAKKMSGTFSCLCAPPVQEEEQPTSDPRRNRSSTVEILATVDYGNPPASNREAMSLHEELVKCKKEAYAVHRLAIKLKREGGDPLKSNVVRDLCRDCGI